MLECSRDGRQGSAHLCGLQKSTPSDSQKKLPHAFAFQNRISQRLSWWHHLKRNFKRIGKPAPSSSNSSHSNSHVPPRHPFFKGNAFQRLRGRSPWQVAIVGLSKGAANTLTQVSP